MQRDHRDDPPEHGVGRRRHRLPALVAALGVVAVVTASLALGAGGSGNGPAAESGQPLSAVGGLPGSTGAGPPRPVTTGDGSASLISAIGATGSSLVIPSLGIDARLVPTGATGPVASASLSIPGDVHTVAWWDGTVHEGDRTVYEDAPEPGQSGVALIAGHIDSATAGPGALYHLKNLTVGSAVEIVDSDHQISTWTVAAAPETALKTELPPSLWVTTGPPKLALVTCGGPFDVATGHYLDNVIVWATPAVGERTGL
jgi:hypothetical protein